MCLCIEGIRSDAGQATVEAAVLIPVLLVTFMLLIQPGILLYDRIVMQNAAAEGCRLLATRSNAAGADSQMYENYIRRRLAGIPEQDNFHVHGGGCSYEIQLDGDESSASVGVRIANRVKLLPLFDGLARAFGGADGEGCIVLSVENRVSAKASWVASSPLGLDPRGWVDRWA